MLFTSLLRAIVSGDAKKSAEFLAASPDLARDGLVIGATREGATDYFFPEIMHYLYAGDTALHAAAAGYRVDIARELIRVGAAVDARDRRGAQPLHYAADGGPGSPHWNPAAQAEMVALLVAAGADVNALDKSGVAPLHRAVRTRCPGAVKALIGAGADVALKNKSGSTPMQLAQQNTGRGGTGLPAAKECQREIIELLQAAGAAG